MIQKQHYKILFTIIGFLHLGHGCTIEGIDNWLVPQTREILDTYRGILFSGVTKNIQAITNVVQREGLNAGPYVEVSLENSLFIIATNTAFENYEDVETQMTLGYTITLRCTDSSVQTLVFIINITDTNNNDPIFLPNNKYEFTIAPPVPPGFLVTTCLNDILVRDIDLTTQRIDFKIEGSDLFEIEFDPSSQVAKEFKAILKTTNLIRSIPEPIRLSVTATDVDLTAGPRRSATATVIISADSQFEFPDEPNFSQPFYFATYKSDNDVILQNTIFLSQGFDDEVKFTFESDHAEYFGLVINKNNLSFNMKAPIPVSLYEERQIYLVVRATREHTSGATATVILKLPEDIPLEFENAVYEGTITDNILQLTDLRLKQGYAGRNITLDIKSEYDFRANIVTNIVKISMDPLAEDVIQNNKFINLQIIASNNRTTAIAVVTLEIIKDDYNTPVFENNLYSGIYSTELGLTLEQIVLTQGFDETVKITLEGKYIEYFKITQNGSKITLTSSTIPPDIFNERHIMITVIGSKPRTVGAHAAVNIALPAARYLEFENDIYEGSIENNNLILNSIVMTDGYASDIKFTLSGEFMTYFSAKNDANLVTINIVKEIPENVLLENDFLTLTLSASGTNAIPTSTSIVLQIIKEDHKTPVFSDSLYYFKYENDELRGNITFVQGFDETVTFELIGDHQEYFTIEPSINFIKLILKSSIPEDVIFNEKIIILTVMARKPLTVGANTAVYITFPQEMVVPTVMAFAQNAYKGNLEDSVLTIDDIVLETGYTSKTKFTLSGEYSENFLITNSNQVVKITPASDWSIEDLENNHVIILEVKATRERAIEAKTVVVIDIYKSVIVLPMFKKAFYKGTFTSNEGLLFEEAMSLEEGFDNTVEFSLDGELSKWFTLEPKENSINLRVNATNPIPDVILENNLHLFFTIIASKPEKITGRAVIFIDLPKENSNIRILQFEHTSYLGNLENRVLELENLRLLGGITSSTTFNIIGDYASYFSISKLSDSIKINLIEPPTEQIENNDFIILNVKAFEPGAVNGHTTVVLNIVKKTECNIATPVFSEAYYSGQYSEENGLVFLSVITLIQGYDETVTFILDDDDSKGFVLQKNGLNNFSLLLNGSLNEPEHINYLLFTVIAQKPDTNNGRAAIVISLARPLEIDNVSFDRVLYNGKLHNGVLSHDTITLSGFNGTNIQIIGEYKELFKSELKNGVVKFETTVAEFPRHITYVALELRASSANAILLIDVTFSENPQVPVVSFKSPSYFLWADVQQTGRVGSVEATADNGEAIVYSLSDVNEQIENRININNDGEILLTAAFDKGVYKFNAIATSMQSKVQATAPVLLRVDTVPECSSVVGLSPLIILEKLEEEPHLNLVVLNKNEHKGCQYILSNVFPKDQSWLYVDNDGLHAKAIDREDKSIAFMTVSQIQVELTLDCDSDGVPALTKRSLGTEDRSDLYYYDNGPNKWVLTDTILFNARRSFVNLIVKDINDNSPIFLGKGNEPIYVGYPVSELEGTVLPRALVELKATDADIGENAAIIYWSEEDNLAVSPNTGLVHVRNKAKLENNSRLTIYAIDQNGKGLNGTIDIVVKLLDKNQIVVLTVRDAFLEDEVDVSNKLSVAVGYEIKILKAVVISNNNEELTRKKRDVANNRASLQLYVYGLFESEPVDINQLTRDISNSNIETVNIARILSLEDHLEDLEIRPSPECDIGLLASTIALAILLFITIVAIAVWFFLKWRRSKNYEQFSNRTSTVSQLASPNIPKIEVITKPRPDIDEIKRTERRLQEMLETPFENALVQIDDDVKPKIETYDEAKVKISSPDAQLPMVIQSIDRLKDNTDDSDENDEFGEIKKPRKSVVTFNENVEKIIHIEDVPDEEEDNGYEIYKF